MDLNYDLTLPCTLGEVLPLLKKDKLIELRDLANIKFSTTLRKQDMLAKLEAELPSNIHHLFDLFDESRASLMRLMLSHRGALPLSELDLSSDDLALLGKHGVFFVGMRDNQPSLGVPLELLESFRRYDGLPYAERVATNTRWVTAVQGLVYYYGVIDIYQAYEYLSLLLGGGERYYRLKPTYWDVIPAMQGFRGLFRTIDRYFCDASLESAAQVLSRRPAEIGYRLYNLEDLYAAADPLYIDPTTEGDLLYEYLIENFDLPEDKARRLMYVGRRFAMREGNVGAAFSAYSVVCGVGVTELAPELVKLVVDYLNNSPHWTLRGHAMAALAPEVPARGGAPGKLVNFSEYKNRMK